MDIREEIARTVRETMFQREWIVPPSVRFAVADALMPLVARIQADAAADAIRHVLDGTILATGDVKTSNGWKHGVAVWDSREHYARGLPRPMEIHEWLAARADRQENPT